MIMASSPIASWQTEGEKVEAVTDFLGLQYHCQWWVQPWDEKMIASWKENYYNLRQHIKKQSRHFADIIKCTVFPVVVYGCESWTIKRSEPWRINAFKLCWWRRLLRVPWTARRSNQSILKEISPEYSLKGLMLRLKLWYFDHLMGKANSLEKLIPLMLEKIEGKRRRER